MKCKVCGADSGKYPLCRICNIKKDKGEIIKCAKCGNWHYTNVLCPVIIPQPSSDAYLYDIKNTLISKTEQTFYIAIKSSLPEGFCIFPQINLASFIERTDDARYHNELFRNVDFLITDAEYHPKIIIEINDQTHMNNDRKERDEKVQKICEEAGIPILKLWTSYGANPEYIKKRIDETLQQCPVPRVHHFKQAVTPTPPVAPSPAPTPTPSKKTGCYIATAVYGSYDCPQVWTLRRYRDFTLAKTRFGRAFIYVYYAISPTLVKWFGDTNWFKNMWKPTLDKMVTTLQNQGVENTPYEDMNW